MRSEIALACAFLLPNSLECICVNAGDFQQVSRCPGRHSTLQAWSGTVGVKKAQVEREGCGCPVRSLGELWEMDAQMRHL